MIRTFCDYLPLLLLLFCCNVVRGSNIGGTRQDITLSDDGGYVNVLIAIHDNVPEDLTLLAHIQDKLNSASEVLTEATGGNLYFKNFSILLPDSWTAYTHYKTPGDATLDRARVIVAPENPAWGDAPYTLQPGLCGREADYIHITPDYLEASSTSAGKKLVREFSHLRWGVFDEDVPDTDTISPKFYSYNKRVYPTKCTQDILGTIMDPTQPKGGCLRDFQTGLPTATCEFAPSQSTTSAASLMYAEFLNSISQFCANKTSSDYGDIIHDHLAPNRQNRICADSVWGVVSSHADFDVSYVSDRLGAPADPVFELLHRGADINSDGVLEGTTQSGGGGGTVVNSSLITGGSGGPCQPELVCLTLDVSGSMAAYDRIGKMKLSVQNYVLNYLPLNTIVAITTFQRYAATIAGMTNVTGDSVRNDLKDLITPISTGGGTDIGSGMAACLQILMDYGGEDNIAGARILVLSDGVGSIGSLDLIVDQGVTVDTIAYSQAASTSLSYISDFTGGLKYFTGDNDAAVGLNDALLSTILRDCESGIVTMVNEQILLPSGDEVVANEFYIDSTLGDETKLVFSYSEDINVNVSTPNNNNYTITKDTDLKTITIQIHGEVTGVVDYEITKVNPTSDEEITVTITSQPIQGVESIEVDFRTDSTSLSFDPSALVTGYVEVFQGLTPILGLTVAVIVSTPSAEDVELSVFDNGLGSDSTPNDGIYTGVFTAGQMDASGYYNIRVLVAGEGFLPESGGDKKRKRRSLGTSLGVIQRSTTGGYLDVSGFYAAADAIAPGRINDFQLQSAIDDNKTLTLVWTAPGDDHFTGTVTEYNIQVSNTNQSNYVTLPTEVIVTNMSLLLQPSGTQVQLSIDAGQINSTVFGLVEGTDITTFFFVIRGVDEVGNAGDWSNAVSGSFIDSEWFGLPVLVGRLPNGTEVYQPHEATESPVTEAQSGNKGNTTVVAVVVPLICLLIIGAVIGIVLFIKMKKKKVSPADSGRESTDTENAEQHLGNDEKPSTPPRHTSISTDKPSSISIDKPLDEKSTKKPKKAKDLPKLRNVPPKKPSLT